MATDERSRRALEQRLEEVLGDEHALTLMKHLPHAEPATRPDLDALEERMNVKLEGLEERFDLKLEALEHRLTASFHSELMAQTRTFAVAMIGTVATVGATVIAAARLA